MKGRRKLQNYLPQGKRKRNYKVYELYEGDILECPKCGCKDIPINRYDTDDDGKYLFWFEYKCECNTIIKYYTNFARYD